MQVTEQSADGLKRKLDVVLPATELTARVDKRIDDMKDRVQLKGFRKGKVPPSHLRKVFGRSLMAEVVQEAVEETTKKALDDRDERPAMQPKVDLPEDETEIEQVINGKADLRFSMDYEILPKFDLVDLSSLDLELLTADVDDSAIDDAITQIAERNKQFEAEADRAAQDGDRVTVSFIGRIDGDAFEGGTADDVQIVLGQGNFIPGFEDGIVGAKADDKRTVKATFPDDYQAEHLAGKTAEFETTVTEVAVPKEVTIDDAFAETLGAENVEKLRDAIKTQIASEYAQVGRAKLKRELLDTLDERHTFELPPTLVEAEFDGLWTQLTEEMKRGEKEFPHEGKTEDETKAEYRKLAERRVRLGLVIGEIGERGEIEVTQEELRRALIEQTRQFPGQEKMVYEYYEKTPGAISQLRAPIFEEKVVDYIVGEAKPTEKKVSVEELTKPIDDEDASASGATASE
ncbi:MAG: trigger factor [Pseudomonadota bacterium]